MRRQIRTVTEKTHAVPGGPAPIREPKQAASRPGRETEPSPVDLHASPSPPLLLWLLDAIDLGIGIIGPDGSVAYLNRGLRAMVEAQDGLSIVRGRLCANEIQFVLANGQPGSPEGHAFRVTRPSGANTYLCLLKPIPVAPREPKKFAFFAADCAKTKAASPRRIVELFGVTNQEARVASLLAAGARLDEASAQMGISIGTGRFHLKNLLGKTSTSRQAELSQLINCLFDKVD